MKTARRTRTPRRNPGPGGTGKSSCHLGNLRPQKALRHSGKTLGESTSGNKDPEENTEAEILEWRAQGEDLEKKMVVGEGFEPS